MKNENVKKILVIRFSSLGDVILTTPLLKLLKEKYNGASIDYCTKKQYSQLLLGNPNISSVIEADDELNFSSLKELKQTIKSGNYNIIVDAHNNLRTFYLRLFSNAKPLIFRKYSLRKFLLVKLKINLMKNLPPIVQRYCDIIYENSKGLLPEIHSESAKPAVDELINPLNIPIDKKLICVVPSSAHFTKTYPAEYYIELINKFEKDKCCFLLVGKGNDRKNIDIIKSGMGTNVYDLCDKINVPELAELMKRCVLVIGGDTGPIHIAESAGANIIMLAGSSVREFGFYPQNKNSVVLENNSLKCRPCSHIGRSECPLGHFKCMRDITSQNLYDTAIRLLN